MPLFRFLGQSNKPAGWDAAFAVEDKEIHVNCCVIEQVLLMAKSCQSETSREPQPARTVALLVHRLEIAAAAFTLL